MCACGGVGACAVACRRICALPIPECAELGPPLIEVHMGGVAWVPAERRRVAQGAIQRVPVPQGSSCLLP